MKHAKLFCWLLPLFCTVAFADKFTESFYVDQSISSICGFQLGSQIKNHQHRKKLRQIDLQTYRCSPPPEKFLNFETCTVTVDSKGRIVRIYLTYDYAFTEEADKDFKRIRKTLRNHLGARKANSKSSKDVPQNTIKFVYQRSPDVELLLKNSGGKLTIELVDRALLRQSYDEDIDGTSKKNRRTGIRSLR